MAWVTYKRSVAIAVVKDHTVAEYTSLMQACQPDQALDASSRISIAEGTTPVEAFEAVRG